MSMNIGSCENFCGIFVSKLNEVRVNVKKKNKF